MTSDTHFYHANIIKYCKRPFANLDEMNREMIRRWNARVAEEDLVIHLGDFCFGGVGKAVQVARSLKGHKVIVRGNHDEHRPSKGWGFTDSDFEHMGFQRVLREAALELPEGKFYLAHHPLIKRDAWPEQALAANCELQLCGHVHEEWKSRGVAYNVGVDVRDFAPATVLEVLRDY